MQSSREVEVEGAPGGQESCYDDNDQEDADASHVTKRVKIVDAVECAAEHP